jgi:DnaJ-class molecular chaperone
MKKLIVLAVLLVAAIFVISSLVMAQEKPKFTYVGDKACKMCHKAQHESWAATKHAKAFDVLKPEEQKKAECVGCHVTGKTATDSLLVGVSCESCHGPGSEYKKMTIMSKTKWAADKAAAMKVAVEAGLIVPTADVCTKCHKKEGNPNFKEFNFEASKGKVHPIVAAAPAPTPADKK